MGHSKWQEAKTIVWTVPGTSNRDKMKESEDVVIIDETSTIRFFGLADGQSGKGYCREGGNAVLRAVFQYVADKGISQMLHREHIDELQYEIIRIVRDTIASLANDTNTQNGEFASTIVILAYDAITEDYVSIHLGDGCIIGRKSNGEISLISPPENGLTANYTWLTTSKGALHHLRITFGKMNAYKRLLLITDGATMIARGRNLSERAKGIIKNGQQEEIVSLLNESNPVDDASCIVIDSPYQTLANDN